MPTIIMIGNPGSGKSTLLSSLVEQPLFPSGPSIGRGKTRELNVVEHKGDTYIDTPGLSDVKFREKAASEIERAFKMGGTFKVFFVMTLESGRVKPDDVATMKLVLDAVPQIGPNGYSIIINKMSKSIIPILSKSEQEREELAACLVPPTIDRGTRSIFYVPMDPHIVDETNKLCQLSPELLSFISNAPSINASPEKVHPIQIGNFEKICDGLRESIQTLREDNEALRRTLAEREAELGKLQWYISNKQHSISPSIAPSDPDPMTSSPFNPQCSFIFINDKDWTEWENSMLSGLAERNNAPCMCLFGLSNRKIRKNAAKAIESTLQKAGNFKIVFIITFEQSLRIKPKHLATIKLVLQAAPQIKDQYSIIVTMSNKTEETFQKSKKDWKDCIPRSMKDGPRLSFCVPSHPAWADKQSKLSAELQKFIVETPEVTITADQVQPIKHKHFSKEHCKFRCKK